MKILWLCNFMLPLIAEHLNKEATNKEGWLSGLADVVLKRSHENTIQLAIAFPAQEELLGDRDHIYKDVMKVGDASLTVYGFYENTNTPHEYDEALEARLGRITADFAPDVVHCFGTEYPHTLAMCKSFHDKSRILVGIQGLCQVYTDAYFANMPTEAVYGITLRDWLKKDSLLLQQRKFAARGAMEVEAVRLAGNVTGRTAWDKYYTEKWNPKAKYYKMNETLRSNFYQGVWDKDKCIPHSIFVSQGDYPIKGLHYLLLALPAIREKYPDVKVYVAGNCLVNFRTWKDKLKLSGYGRYLRSLIRKYDLEKCVEFVGRLNAEQMKDRYLKSSLFVCCSSIENSPNSLGEAMLLGMPCVSAAVGGIASIFDEEKDGILYEGYTAPRQWKTIREFVEKQEKGLEQNVRNLQLSILEMWKNEKETWKFCDNARKHAKITHDREVNYQRMTEIYASIIASETK